MKARVGRQGSGTGCQVSGVRCRVSGVRVSSSEAVMKLIVLLFSRPNRDR